MLLIGDSSALFARCLFTVLIEYHMQDWWQSYLRLRIALPAYLTW